MPFWKQPFWYWIKWFNAWPFSVEALSGLFDFNHAPFFQSFMEVRVETVETGVWFSNSTVSTVHCNGGTCKSAVQSSRPVRRTTIPSNSSCRWTVLDPAEQHVALPDIRLAVIGSRHLT